MRRFGGFVLLGVILNVCHVTDVSGQPVFEPLPPWTINTINLETSQTYRVVFTGTGDVWGTGAPAFNQSESLRVGPYGLPTKRLGGFFEVCVIVDCLEFGAAVDYGLNLGGAVTFQANASIGTLTVQYPMYVTINWPNWQGLRPGDKVRITTSYKPDRAASMTSTDPSFFAKLAARVDVDAGIGAQAKVFSIPYPPTPFPGFVSVHESRDLFDTNQIFGSSDWTDFTISPARGRARRPSLGTNGWFGVPDRPKALTSYRDEGFLNVGINLSQIISDALLGGLRLSDTRSFGPLNVEYHVLGLSPNLSVAAEQELFFDAYPQITFTIDHDGTVSHVTVDAGQSVELILPADGSAYTITPTINSKRHSVTNRTALHATAEALIDPFRVKVGVPPVDFGPVTVRFPSINFNPFSAPKSVGLGALELVSFLRAFTLTPSDASDFVGEPYVLSPDPTTPRLITVCRTVDELNTDDQLCGKTLIPRSTGRVVFAEAEGGYDSSTDVRVNGEPVAHSAFGDSACAAAGGLPLGPGQLCLTLPGHLMTQPGALHVQLVRVSVLRPPRPADFSNTVDLHITAFPLLSSSFKQLALGQILNSPGDICSGDNCFVLIGSATAGAGPIQIFGKTFEFVSREFPVEFITAESVLTWNDVPLATTIQPDIKVTFDAGIPVYTIAYDISAIVPNGLQTGGVHKLSFINSGINADETVLDQVTVLNPVPTIDALFAGGSSSQGIRLVINGTEFTQDSVAEWDGTPLPRIFMSSNALLIEVPHSVLTPGNHFVAVRNPSPGGGLSNAKLYTVPSVGQPSLAVSHALFRNSKNEIGDVVTFTNTGTGVLDGLEITSIKLHVGRGGYSVNRKVPETIPSIEANGANSLIVYFPGVGKPGQEAEIRIRATLDGKQIHIDIPVTLPQ